MRAAKVLIADDHEVVRHGIRVMVQGCQNLEVCGEASDGRQAVQLATKLRPDIVIIDIGMPQLNGLDATKQIVHMDPNVKVLILTMHESEQIVREVLAAGARGYLLKSDAGRDLISAIEALVSRKTFFTSKVAEIVLETYLKGGPEQPVSKDVLTSREREVVQLLAEGKSTKEVAVALGSEREDGRNSPVQPHAEARRSFSEPVGPLCGTQQYRASCGTPIRTPVGTTL